MTDVGGIADLEAWGRSVLEEVLFRAGLALSSAGGAARAETHLDFRVTATGADRSLILEFERVGGAPERLRITLDT
ncbi:hypothetical protein [Emcibacter sp. SYSU 3D8]|uniref:hypothetical protein n=1 Tax=Emcibacter sp. SYSU 3D8 TaxID=3133969 RepID=UPI0031FE95B2